VILTVGDDARFDQSLSALGKVNQISLTP